MPSSIFEDGEKLSDDIVCVVVKALLSETLFTLLVMETSHEVLTIKLKLGDVLVDSCIEFTLPLVVTTCEIELEVERTDEVFIVLEAVGDAVVDDEDTLSAVKVEEEEAIEQN